MRYKAGVPGGKSDTNWAETPEKETRVPWPLDEAYSQQVTS